MHRDGLETEGDENELQGQNDWPLHSSIDYFKFIISFSKNILPNKVLDLESLPVRHL